jgi:hypothetical protein
MAMNIFTSSADRAPKSSRVKRRGARPPSRRAIGDLLEWIDDAHTAQRTWARNTLLLVSTIAVLVWVMLRLGLLPE